MFHEQIIQIQVDQPASRLDQLLAKKVPQLSRSQLQKLIRQGEVLVDGQPVRPSVAVQPGDVITLRLPALESAILHPESIPLDIIFEDADLIVINKPAGMVVHPAQGHSRGTLVNALLARYADLAAMSEMTSDTADRPGIVHRKICPSRRWQTGPYPLPST
jgi:23S rRNA pseudouridine1911/1915/1917 synthase